MRKHRKLWMAAIALLLLAAAFAGQAAGLWHVLPLPPMTRVLPSPGTQQENAAEISDTLASRTRRLPWNATAEERLEYAIYTGQGELGKPYDYGATGPEAYDCSGFTGYCYGAAGAQLKRTAKEQGYDEAYEEIADAQALRRGDLVCFDTVSDGDRSDHTGIYLGAGWFMHASSAKGCVIVSTMADGYYSRAFSWGRRILGR